METLNPLLPISEVIPLLKLGLEHFDVLASSEKKVRVKDITVINGDTLCCHFYPYASTAINVKLEIGTIVSFFDSFFRGDELCTTTFTHYAVRAFDKTDTEIMYAISSKKAAELITSGGSIEWLKATWFQENTEDYRLSQAKRIIFEIENSLREAVKQTLHHKFGSNWWDIALNNNLGNSVKEMYSNQFGILISDGAILINYTYTLQLKKIIVTYWADFTRLFASKVEFEELVEKLNLIRREEAHNRSISESQLKELAVVHEKLLSKISIEFNTIESTYLIDNWKMKLKSIMIEGYQPLYRPDEIVQEGDLFKKLLKSTASTINLITYLNELITKLESISVPIQKKLLHTRLVDLLKTYCSLHNELLESIKAGEIASAQGITRKIQNHQLEMDDFVKNFLVSEG